MFTTNFQQDWDFVSSVVMPNYLQPTIKQKNKEKKVKWKRYLTFLSTPPQKFEYKDPFGSLTLNSGAITVLKYKKIIWTFN